MIMVIVCSNKATREVLKEIYTEKEINNHLWTFEKLLALVEWGQKEIQWKSDETEKKAMNNEQKKIRKFMKEFKECCPREDSQGWDIAKFDKLLHLTTIIQD